MRFLILLLVVEMFVVSCATTNNLYVYDANPCEPEQFKVNAGIGTGLKPKFDTIVQTQNQLQYLPVLSFNGQLGLTRNLDKTNLRFSIWSPLFASLGGRIGIQQSFFNHYSKFNLALGVDLGYSFTSDSTNNSQRKINQHVLTSELYIPFTYNFDEQFSLTITPKLTYAFFNFPLTETPSRDTKKYDQLKINSPGLTIGITFYQFHIEGTVIKYLNKYIPSLGIAYIINIEKL
jgi:hypothetical protein